MAGFDDAYRELLARWGRAAVARTADTPRARTRVNVVGDPRGAGAATVLLPGGGASSVVWFPQVAAADGAFIAPDLPADAGYSERRRGLRGARDVADWCEDVLAAAGVPGRKAVTVVGHSYGAQLAVRWALQSPARIAGLTLLDPNGVFARVAPAVAVHALPQLIAPSGARWRRFLNWETRGATLDPVWFELTTSAAAMRMRPLFLPRPKPAEIEALRALPGGIRVVLARRSRYHDATRVAASLAEQHPWIVVETVDASHHELPFVWRP
ncbi:alpha/beta hydrolase [Tsukamurella sp. 8F]|uniref:alpha/beta fold hydrolase n=1 Tax=unclassified Tsukamurella TaxID=2633480 RepID=UPI0023B8B6C8|nr:MULTISPECIES: alpha/beta hydrolase family protein [unclassified Tsukamurella]MDF0532139.1 alpha/beta hydrolase [Tsukamurella sp. 8J]MDF0585180.1 alpha/beta hydrolase [Tsukamurella sp. 8F]